MLYFIANVILLLFEMHVMLSFKTFYDTFLGIKILIYLKNGEKFSFRVIFLQKLINFARGSSNLDKNFHSRPWKCLVRISVKTEAGSSGSSDFSEICK